MNKNEKIKVKNDFDTKIDLSSLGNKVVKNSIDSNYDLDLLEKTNVFYSERYGWTLKRES